MIQTNPQLKQKLEQLLDSAMFDLRVIQQSINFKKYDGKAVNLKDSYIFSFHLDNEKMRYARLFLRHNEIETDDNIIVPPGLSEPDESSFLTMMPSSVTVGGAITNHILTRSRLHAAMVLELMPEKLVH